LFLATLRPHQVSKLPLYSDIKEAAISLIHRSPFTHTLIDHSASLAFNYPISPIYQNPSPRQLITFLLQISYSTSPHDYIFASHLLFTQARRRTRADDLVTLIFLLLLLTLPLVSPACHKPLALHCFSSLIIPTYLAYSPFHIVLSASRYAARILAYLMSCLSFIMYNLI
jgi:hypothetical protein